MTEKADARDGQHLALLKDVTFQPVFIIGDHRSGTTLLHRLLASTGCFNYVSAYHVIKYDQVLSDKLAGRTEQGMQEVRDEFTRLGLKNRDIDETPAVPEAPIEYGFILGGPKDRRPRITEETLDKFGEMARKVTYVGDPAKPLLLKNPWDVISFMEIKDWFPEARFIFIHRHPVAIMNSQIRAIRTVLGKKSAFACLISKSYRAMWDRPFQVWLARTMDKPPLLLWERMLAHHTVKMARYFLDHHKSLPPGDYISVQYEQLCREPDAIMKKITDFAEVHPSESIRYADQIAPREPRILPEVLKRFRAVRGRLRPYLEFQQYTLDPK